MEIAIIPNFIIKIISQNEMRKIHINIMLSSGLLIFVVSILSTHNSFFSWIPHFCLFQHYLQIPCPGCGIIRSLLALTKGHFSSAWVFNPAGVLFSFYLIAQIPLRIIAITDPTTQNRIIQISRTGSNAVIISLFSIWILRLI